MSIREIISPNVSLILALDIPFQSNVYAVKLHQRGIIEIDTIGEEDYENSDDVLAGVEAAFKNYDEEGALYPVNVTGLTSVLGGKVGSHRFCAWDGAFADKLTAAINNAEILQLVNDNDGLWQFEGVSKYFRFMRYDQGGEHFPHFDSDFEVPGQYTTRYSLVMYFNDCDSGEIAFINTDPKSTLRDDWSRQAMDSEIFLKILPEAGKIVLFPHDVCHTVLPFTDEDRQRYIVRGDLIFTKVR